MWPTAMAAILPQLEAFKPEFLFISAGFDGHKFDPLAQLYKRLAPGGSEGGGA